MLAGVLDRDGQQHSATQTRQQALADADHLAVLHAIWTAETTPARDQRLPRPAHERPAARPPPGTRPPGDSGCGGPCAPPNWPAWTPPGSWPTRSPNGTWPDPATSPPSSTPASATASAPWSRSRPGRWSAQVPALADPERRAYVAEIAALMDARKDRIGEHAASTPRPGPSTRSARSPPTRWTGWTGSTEPQLIGAWRELSGYDHPADPIGPEPAAAAPDARAAWHEALAALGPADGPDVRGMPDGRLLHLRDTYPVETAWAPQYVGDELRQVRAAAWDARLAGLRAAAEARAADRRGDPGHAAAQHKLAAGYQALERGLPAARGGLRPDDGRPRRLGSRHPRPAPAGRRRRRRTAPPPPRPALRAAALGRTRSPPPAPSATTSP